MQKVCRQCTQAFICESCPQALPGAVSPYVSKGFLRKNYRHFSLLVTKVQVNVNKWPTDTKLNQHQELELLWFSKPKHLGSLTSESMKTIINAGYKLQRNRNMFLSNADFLWNMLTQFKWHLFLNSHQEISKSLSR